MAGFTGRMGYINDEVALLELVAKMRCTAIEDIGVRDRWVDDAKEIGVRFVDGRTVISPPMHTKEQMVLFIQSIVALEGTAAGPEPLRWRPSGSISRTTGP